MTTPPPWKNAVIMQRNPWFALRCPKRARSTLTVMPTSSQSLRCAHLAPRSAHSVGSVDDCTGSLRITQPMTVAAPPAISRHRRSVTRCRSLEAFSPAKPVFWAGRWRVLRSNVKGHVSISLHSFFVNRMAGIVPIIGRYREQTVKKKVKVAGLGQGSSFGRWTTDGRFRDSGINRLPGRHSG